MLEVKDVTTNNVNIPDKSFQDSQKTTDQIASLSERAAKAEAEVESLKEKIKKDDKKITVTLQECKENQSGMFSYLYGAVPMRKSAKVASIEVNNVDEVDKFLTSVLESDISQEKEELQKKYESLEGKLDVKDRDITKLKREAIRSREVHDNHQDDLDSHYNREIIKIRKTAKGKVEKQLINKDVEFAELTNQLELERQEANLRETELLGNLDHYKQANDALEVEVKDLKGKEKFSSTKLGGFIQRMMHYKKAQNRVANFSTRNRHGGGITHPFMIRF